uniref:Uncharacterized protein n=1 Tax=Manihot esculenta TaxID=3983 RepID=A0A2C9VH38_MANES
MQIYSCEPQLKCPNTQFKKQCVIGFGCTDWEDKI